jgi:hypothetical protein
MAIHVSPNETLSCRVAALLAVLGGLPFLSENEGHVSLTLPVGLAGQHAPSSKLGTLPSARASLKPAQDAQGTLW